MRDPKRIKPILAELERIWSETPDQRFFQLISNLSYKINETELTDLFYLEDDKTLEYFKNGIINNNND